MHSKGGIVNRVELECQVLCASLRQSWMRRDKVGAFTSIRELSHLFPDLLPPPEDQSGTNKTNYYEILGVRPQAGLNTIAVGYFRACRRFLKKHNPKEQKQVYNNLLNAGFVLRKPRLRLSHDLVVSRRWLHESQTKIEQPKPNVEEAKAAMALLQDVQNVKDSTTTTTTSSSSDQRSEPAPVKPIEEKEQEKVSVEKTDVHLPEKQNNIASSVSENKQKAPDTFVFNEEHLRKPESFVKLPSIINLLESARLITKLEVQALKAQIELAPNISAEQLVFNAGYATKQEIDSLRLAEYLLSSGKITMAQFQVAMYDERTSGLRMAESLQVRGWLETEVRNSLEDLNKQSS